MTDDEARDHDGQQSRSSLEGLVVSGEPRAEYRERLAAFAPLIGSWDLTVTSHGRNGLTMVLTGEWHFGWALDGRAVADVWITPSRAARAVQGDGEWGLTVRFYDEVSSSWRSTWLGPKNAVVMPFTGVTTEDGQIVLTGTFEPGVRTQWIFSEITANSFSWRAEEAADDAEPVVTQTFVATRTSRERPRACASCP